MRISWLLRGSSWRHTHLRECTSCYRKFRKDAPGAIDAVSQTEDEAEQCLDFRGYTYLTQCPACAAPVWKEAVRVALYRSHFS